MMQVEIKEAVHRCLEESGISISSEEKDNVVAQANETMREKDEIDQAFTDMMLKGGGDADV